MTHSTWYLSCVQWGYLYLGGKSLNASKKLVVDMIMDNGPRTCIHPSRRACVFDTAMPIGKQHRYEARPTERVDGSADVVGTVVGY